MSEIIPVSPPKQPAVDIANGLAPTKFDRIVPTWTAGTVSGFNATKVEYYLHGQVVRTVDISYDANDNPDDITISA